MAVTMEGSAFARVMEQSMQAMVDDLYGLRHEPGLSFKVRGDDMGLSRMLFGPRRVYDRPFTRAEHRKHVWETRRRRWKFRLLHPPREARRRLSAAWDALRGRENDYDW